MERVKAVDRDVVAGRRVRLARELLGFSKYKLAKAWERFNLQKSGKHKLGLPISHIVVEAWEVSGVPHRARTNNGKEPFSLLAEFFKVAKSAFIEEPELWPEDKFIKIFKEKADKKTVLTRKPPFQVPSCFKPGFISEQFEKMFAGFHWAYFLFPVLNKEKKCLNCVYKALIHAHAFDPEHKTIKAKLLGRGGMLFDGQIVLGIKKTTWLFTRFDPGDEYSQNSIFILTTPVFLNDASDGAKGVVTDRLGIILAESTLPEQLKRDARPLITAGRILIRKIPDSAARTMEDFENQVALYRRSDFEDEAVLSLIKNNPIDDFATLTPGAKL